MTNSISFEAKNIRYDIAWDAAKASTNLRKHGMDFRDAATVFLGELTLCNYDMAHSLDEERWVTLGYDRAGRVLVVVHTWLAINSGTIDIRIISARSANKRERQAFAEYCQMHSRWEVQQQPSIYGAKMNITTLTTNEDDTPPEFDFSRAIRGKFYHPNMQLQMPIYLEPAMMTALIEMAGRKKIKLSSLINDLVEKGFELLEAEDESQVKQ